MSRDDDLSLRSSARLYVLGKELGQTAPYLFRSLMAFWYESNIVAVALRFRERLGSPMTGLLYFTTRSTNIELFRLDLYFIDPSG